MFKKTLFYLSPIILFQVNLSAQNISHTVVASTGGTYKNSTIEIDWTLGELINLPIQNNNILLTQGFHQQNPNVQIIKPNGIDIKIFPNPTFDELRYVISAEENQSYKYRLFDASGKLILSQNIEGRDISDRIDLVSLPAGIYLLHFLYENNRTLNTYKIQKLN